MVFEVGRANDRLTLLFAEFGSPKAGGGRDTEASYATRAVVAVGSARRCRYHGSC